MGGKPIMALAIVGMPIDVLPLETIGAILEGGGRRLRATPGIPIAGGHTIDSVEPIYGLVALGLVHPAGSSATRRAGPATCWCSASRSGSASVGGAEEGRLDAAGYERMIATTTRLNTPGTGARGARGVHALTDVTGFGLAGHALEMARGVGCGEARLGGGAVARRRPDARGARLRHRRERAGTGRATAAR